MGKKKKQNKKGTIKNKEMQIKKILLISIIPIVVIGLLIYIVIEQNLYEIKYECDEGYIYDKEICIKEIDKKPANPNYYCTEGYVLEGTKCIKKESIEALAKWYCPSGYTMRKEKYPDICYKETKVGLSIISYYCPSGYTLEGKKCYNTSSIAATINNVCTNSAIYNSATKLCHLAGVTGSCPSGYSVYSSSGSFKTCVAAPQKIYTCPSGYTQSGTKCIKNSDVIDASYIRGCKDGYEINQKEQKCIKTDYKTPEYKIYCDNGYELKNETCIKVSKIDAEKYFKCDKEYELKNEECVKYDEREPIEVKVKKDK